MRSTWTLLAIVCVFTLLATPSPTPLADDELERRIEELERRLHELEAETTPRAPPTTWDGKWTGKAPALVPGGECKFVFRPAMDINLNVADGQISGTSRGRAAMKLVVELHGETAADGSWRAQGRGYAAGAWSMVFRFWGDFTTGDGAWRESNYGCRGELSIGRAE